MAGTLFVITVPKSEYEDQLKKSDLRNKYGINHHCDDIKFYTDDFYDTSCGNNSEPANENDEKPVTFKNTKHIQSNPNLLYDDIILEDVSSEKILSEVLHALHIKDSAWSQSQDNSYWQVTFSVQDQARSERTLRILRGADLGTRPHTSLCILPCSLYYKPISLKTSKDQPDAEETTTQSTWSNFVQSVSARQTIAQVVEQIKSDAALTFDFCFLIVVAALLAAIGLVENSTVFIVSSMLISPLMGPIVAGSFGTAIRDGNLLRMGVIHELCGLFICLVIGFIFGLIVCGMEETYGVKELPTSEILSRCNIRSLWIGVLSALPSGAAVSIAILANNVSSLVGVAISASLLPPAVNAGLLWAMAVIQMFFTNDSTRKKMVLTHVFFENPALELAVDGFISLCLTLVNIACIYFAGIVVYKIKEVAPAFSNDSDFWRNAIRAVRDYNKSNLHETRGAHKNSAKLRDLTVSCNGTRRLNTSRCDFLKRISGVTNSNKTWSPYGEISQRVSIKDMHIPHRRYSETTSHNNLPRGHILHYSNLYERNCIPEQNTISEVTSLLSERNSDIRSKFTVTPVIENV